MLVLSRSTGQEIKIGNDISVKILKVDRGQVRIGIAAPREVSVHRDEIYRLIQQEQKGAFNGKSDV